MVETSETVNAILWLVVAMISLLVSCVFYISYRRIKSKKLLLTTGAFLIFFIKSLLLGMRLFVPESEDETWFLDDEFWWSVAAFLDVAIIGLIAFALKKKE